MIKSNQNGAISEKAISQFRSNFLKTPSNRLAMNAVTRGNLQEIAINRDVLNNIQFSFSLEIEESADITDQKKSGTCWMFAELNWLRIKLLRELKIKDFEFSENWVMFWDKFEKANYFLENIIQLGSCDIDDRKLRHLLASPISDGGEWHMLVNIINKYGLVPKSAMPDTFNRENSRFLNEVTAYKLREGAAKLRSMMEKGKSEDLLKKEKISIMESIFTILVICMGMPPEKFSWSYRDKDKNFNRVKDITPKEFYDKFVGVDTNKIYSLLSCPSSRTEFEKVYTIEFFNNSIGGEDWIWLNVAVKELKKIALKMLKDGEPVLYGCDVIQESHTKDGLMHHDIYQWDLVFGTSFKMDKKTRVDYGQTVLTHSMVITGVDLVDNKPVLWKVENSWGGEVGKKGYFLMSDKWFDEHVFDLIVPEKYMTEKLLELFKQEPIQLPPWFPMA